ncbi:cyclopropane-fatty-acyl-phospholipid synthase, partial [Clavulina sp. PMI_390]
EPVCEFRVRNGAFWLRLAAMSDLGFSEAYMYGDVDVSDLLSAFKIFLLNKQALSPSSSSSTSSSSSSSAASLALASTTHSLAETLVARPLSWLSTTRFVNSLAGAKKNISAHYDISNEMFAAFLSEDMTYSCAIFDRLDEDLEEGNKLPVPPTNGMEDESTRIPQSMRVVHANAPPSRAMTTDALYSAEMRKLEHILRKADIRPGMRLLEIGTGWGSLAMLAAQLHPTLQIDTITLSSQQASLARARIAALGPAVSARITVHEMDYRDILRVHPDWEHAFDRVVSIEMIEAVGREWLEVFWGVVDRCLKTEGAVGVVQVITIPESRLEQYSRGTDFIRKWVLFPGGFLPSLTLLISSLTHATSGALTIDSVSNIGPHYARTLREWRDRFENAFEQEIVPALEKAHPEIMGEGVADEEKRKEAMEVFRRKWLYYYCYCEIGFSERLLGTHIITFMREGNTKYGVQL